MGGKSGIQIIDDINPANSQGAVGSTVSTIGNNLNDFGSRLGNDINETLEDDKEFYIAAAALAGGAYAGGFFDPTTAGAASGASSSGALVEGTGYYGGPFSLGADTTISGTGISAAELGGAQASSPYALGYYTEYLSSPAALSTEASYAGTLLGGAAESSSPWWSSIASGAGTVVDTAFKYATLTGALTPKFGGSSPGSSISIGQPSGGGSTPNNIIVGGGGTTPGVGYQSSGVTGQKQQSAMAIPSSLLMIGVIGAIGYILLKKKR